MNKYCTQLGSVFYCSLYFWSGPTHTVVRSGILVSSQVIFLVPIFDLVLILVLFYS